MPEQTPTTYAAGVPDAKTDPTANVLDLVDAAVKRLNDLRAAEVRRTDDLRKAERRRINEQMALRAKFDSKLREAEAKRIDAIRAVDVNAVSVASERANQQATVLANQVAASAETLRALVATTASSNAQQLSQITQQLTDRLAKLEQAQYEGSGKQSVLDPQMTALLHEFRSMREDNKQGEGKLAGYNNVWVILIGLAVIGGFVVAALKW